MTKATGKFVMSFCECLSVRIRIVMPQCQINDIYYNSFNLKTIFLITGNESIDFSDLDSAQTLILLKFIDISDFLILPFGAMNLLLFLLG